MSQTGKHRARLFRRRASSLSLHRLHRQREAPHQTLSQPSANRFLFRDSAPDLCLRKSEEATRQQGGLFFRENSSNGGKAIRTFWRNTKFGKNRCQGQNSLPVSHYLGVSYRGYSIDNSHLRIRLLFALSCPPACQSTIKSAA
jgi:hypothetical protein